MNVLLVCFLCFFDDFFFPFLFLRHFNSFLCQRYVPFVGFLCNLLCEAFRFECFLSVCFGDIFFLFSNDCVEFLLPSGFFFLPSGLGCRV